MRVYIPYCPENPKTRLEPIFKPAERSVFSRAMLDDVIEAVRTTGHVPRVLATEPVDGPFETVVSTASLSEAVNDVLDGHFDGESAETGMDVSDDPGVAVVMADLALATPAALTRLFELNADLTIAPGRRGGTNAIVVRVPEFRVDYHGTSYRDHRRIAERNALDLATVDSFKLATDIDEPADLVEVLLHGRGRSLDYLAETIELDVGEGGVDVTRTDGENAFVNQ